MICATETRYALYRFYDDHEDLLYVGISNDPWRRWREHVLNAPWYPQVQHQAVTWYDSERAARAAETRAIRGESPRFNVAGAVRPPEPEGLPDSEKVISICAAWIIAGALPGLVAAALWTALPAHSVAAAYVLVIARVALVPMLSTLLPMAALTLIMCTPWIYRFACWLNLHYGDLGCKRPALAAAGGES
jgi:hypothetical protein